MTQIKPTLFSYHHHRSPSAKTHSGTFSSTSTRWLDVSSTFIVTRLRDTCSNDFFSAPTYISHDKRSACESPSRYARHGGFRISFINRFLKDTSHAELGFFELHEAYSRYFDVESVEAEISSLLWTLSHQDQRLFNSSRYWLSQVRSGVDKR